MRARLALVIAIAWTDVARADAIIPFEGECPPGLRIGVSGHAESCVPIACSSDAECGRGAACREVHECFAPRRFTSDGRVIYDTPVMREVVVGSCGGDRTCAEGECRTRRQCEPTDDTPAWDPRMRRWTGETHRSGTCSVGHGGGSPAWLALVAMVIALRARRFR
ncbi:MYXO-CTERM sorting domain-containing protein [Sandaracinus amylolyticus]|nr:MYXO-CTERM sorting domain-containing protein [Sandaracinus amylolyticus]